ncbi:MAG: hypothetical protein R3C49_12680 [Planctomycetaceae bacterium]
MTDLQETKLIFLAFAALLVCPAAPADDPPLHPTDRQQIINRYEKILQDNPIDTFRAPNALEKHSKRGDALFILGRFAESVTEYQAMVAISPETDASHWRLGIALFFAKLPDQAARQFEKYHSFDNVDRENGIWRYLCQYQAHGQETADRELIRYNKDDREPFPAVYRLFDGSLTPEAALAAIPNDLPADERDKRLFYTELYLGMLNVVQKKPTVAREQLRRATGRKWPRTAGYGPNFMWHVARLQFEQLDNSVADRETSPPKPDAENPTPDAAD